MNSSAHLRGLGLQQDTFTIDLEASGFQTQRVAEFVRVSTPCADGGVVLKMTPARALALAASLTSYATPEE